MADAFIDDLVSGVLAGNRRMAARAISLIEDGAPGAEAVQQALFPHTGHAYVVGLTGPPGAGKSTLADDLIRVLREDGNTVGVVAVDPNSPFSGGAILGDRIRMMRHASDLGLFIRSMGARGHLGGLSLAVRGAARVLDAMGKDYVILETVGVGQSELEVAQEADTTVLVLQPDSGDGVQAIKAGIMEIADVFVVNKADNPQAQRMVADIRDMLRMVLVRREWTPPIVQTVATEGKGVEDLWIRIREHRNHLRKSGEFDRRRRERLEREIMELVEERVRTRIIEPRLDTANFQHRLDTVMARQTDPFRIADSISSTIGCPQPERVK